MNGSEPPVEVQCNPTSTIPPFEVGFELKNLTISELFTNNQDHLSFPLISVFSIKPYAVYPWLYLSPEKRYPWS